MLTVSDSAIKRISELLKSRDQSSIGIRIGVKNSGCSGLSYSIEFADLIGYGDEVVYKSDEFCVLVDPKAIMYIAGSEMDFLDSPMKSGFVFNNPNKKGGCGCGKSFRV